MISCRATSTRARCSWAAASGEPRRSTARATILQSNHEFDRALADLNRAIARDPKNGRALLVRSTVLTVQGKYAEARADCPKLYGLVPEFYVFACTAAIDSIAGKTVPAAATLERAGFGCTTRPSAENGVE